MVKGLGLAHKSEHGAVKLGVTHATLADTIREMNVERVLVEEMVTDAVAELLVGVLRDPAHGFVLTVGAGGVMTELWQDTQSLLLPASRDDIRAALDRLRIAPLLHGFRGKPAVQIDAVLDAIEAVGRFVEAHADRLEEIEINPLMATPSRTVAVDALMRMVPNKG